MGCYNFSMRANTWSIKMEDFFVVWLACQFSMSLSQSPQTTVFSCSCECPFCSLWMLLLLFLARLSPSQFGRGMSLGWDQCAQMGSNSLSAGIVAKVAQNSWTISRIGGGNAPKISKEGKDSYPSSKNKKDKKKKEEETLLELLDIPRHTRVQVSGDILEKSLCIEGLIDQEAHRSRGQNVKIVDVIQTFCVKHQPS